MMKLLSFLLIGSLPTYSPTPEDLGWETLVEAIIQVESGGRADAVGDNGKAVGVLQLHPLYVIDVNRILSEGKYTLNDRLDPVKSREMFDILQGHYNPTRDHDKAIKLHNRGQAYYLKVKNKYDEIKQSN